MDVAVHNLFNSLVTVLIYWSTATSESCFTQKSGIYPYTKTVYELAGDLTSYLENINNKKCFGYLKKQFLRVRTLGKKSLFVSQAFFN